MSSSSIRLTGWKAVAVVAVVLAFGAVRWATARQSLDTQGRAALEEWVALEIQRDLLDEVDEGAPPSAEQAQALVEAADVRIRELAARGPLDDMVVRVELEAGPAMPEDAPLTRFYRMAYSDAAGWRHRGGASALAWHLALF